MCSSLMDGVRGPSPPMTIEFSAAACSAEDTPVQGENEVWGALPLESMGFGLIDTFARYFNGQSLSPIVTEPPQWQILTRSNIASAHFDSQDNYIGYADFAAAWAKLWDVN
jgi:hypothetical protein